MRIVRVVLILAVASLPVLTFGTTMGQSGEEIVAPDAMIIDGVAPVPAGSEVRIEALDPVAIRGVECSKTLSVAAELPSSSRFSITVNRSCFANLAANLRICWGPDMCQAFDFEGARRVNLGTLSVRAPEVIVPDAGGALHAEDGGGTSMDPTVLLLGGVLMIAGIFVSSISFARTRSKPKR